MLLLHLRIAGCLLVGLAASHLLLPRRLNWKEELGRLTLANRQIFLVHVFFIALILTMMGALSLFFPRLLVAPSPLARVLLGAMAVFWATRLVFQWFVYDWSLWKGDRGRTAVHWVLTAAWIYLTAVYAAAFWMQLSRSGARSGSSRSHGSASASSAGAGSSSLALSEQKRGRALLGTRGGTRAIVRSIEREITRSRDSDASPYSPCPIENPFSPS